MKRLLLALCLLPAIASAEYLPDGCYVAYSNPGSCWYSYSGNVQWTTYTDRQTGAYHYGTAIEAIINQHGQYKALAEEFQSIATACATDYSAVVDQYNGLVSQFNTQLAALKKQKSLVSRLKKACGSRCRSIK